jgi:hypothetical protein
MDRVQAVWSGWGGAPAYSNFYFTSNAVGADLNTITAAVRTLFSGITLCLPTPVSIQVSPVVQQIDPVTGILIVEKTATTTPAVVAGAGGPNFSSPVGACIIWRTSTVINGHTAKGKTFVVPLTAAAYDVDGTLLTNRLTELRAAATTLVGVTVDSGNGLAVWHRPVGGAGGADPRVTVATVNDRSAILKSRRARS